MKRGWVVSPIEDLHKTITPPAKIRSTDYQESGAYPIVSQDAKEINGYWDKAADLVHVDNNAVICFGDHTKVVKFIDFDFVQGADGLKILLPNKQIYPRFFYYGLLNTHFRDLGYARHYKLLKKQLMPYPESFSEQKRIVGILDAAFGKIDAVQRNAERNLANAKELFQRVLDEEMTPKKGWENSALTEVCSHIVDCPHSTPKKVSFPTEYPCIRTSELRNGHIAWETMQYLEEEEYQKRIKRLAPTAGDIVYGREGTFGDAVCLPNTHKFSLGQRTMLFRPDRGKIDSLYLLYFIISNHVYSQIQNNGCGVGHVNVKDIKKFRIFYPASIDVQRKTANKIEFTYRKIQEQINLFLTVLSASNELKQQILAKAFNGEL